MTIVDASVTETGVRVVVTDHPGPPMLYGPLWRSKYWDDYKDLAKSILPPGRYGELVGIDFAGDEVQLSWRRTA